MPFIILCGGISLEHLNGRSMFHKSFSNVNNLIAGLERNAASRIGDEGNVHAYRGILF